MPLSLERSGGAERANAQGCTCPLEPGEEDQDNEEGLMASRSRVGVTTAGVGVETRLAASLLAPNASRATRTSATMRPRFPPVLHSCYAPMRVAAPASRPSGDGCLSSVATSVIQGSGREAAAPTP